MEWRLDKFLTQIPVGTRSQVKDMIKKGRVCVNGVHAQNQNKGRSRERQHYA